MDIRPTLTERQKFLLAHEAAMAAYTGPITVIDGFTEIAPITKRATQYKVTPENSPELFRPIPGFDRYLCRNDGQIWTWHRNDYLVSHIPHSDIYQLAKKVGGKSKMHRVRGNELKKKIWGRAAV